MTGILSTSRRAAHYHMEALFKMEPHGWPQGVFFLFCFFPRLHNLEYFPPLKLTFRCDASLRVGDCLSSTVRVELTSLFSTYGEIGVPTLLLSPLQNGSFRVCIKEMKMHNRPFILHLCSTMQNLVHPTRIVRRVSLQVFGWVAEETKRWAASLSIYIKLFQF